jgi:hypothetical protein
MNESCELTGYSTSASTDDDENDSFRLLHSTTTTTTTRTTPSSSLLPPRGEFSDSHSILPTDNGQTMDWKKCSEGTRSARSLLCSVTPALGQSHIDTQAKAERRHTTALSTWATGHRRTGSQKAGKPEKASFSQTISLPQTNTPLQLDFLSSVKANQKYGRPKIFGIILRLRR